MIGQLLGNQLSAELGFLAGKQPLAWRLWLPKTLWQGTRGKDARAKAFREINKELEACGTRKTCGRASLRQKSFCRKAFSRKSSHPKLLGQKQPLADSSLHRTKLWQVFVASGSSRQKLSETEKPALESSWRREMLLRRICCTKKAPAKSFFRENSALAGTCGIRKLAPKAF